MKIPNAAMTGRKLQVLVTRDGSTGTFVLQQADGPAHLSEKKSPYTTLTLWNLLYKDSEYGRPYDRDCRYI